MSGGQVPYHLRQNKAIDRGAFLEFLQLMNRIVPLHDHRYVGFGGPFLEDFKLIHGALGLKKLSSIEEDRNVYCRQKFNLPIGLVDRQLIDSSEFIRDLDPDEEPHIIWLDYASPRQLGSQVSEFGSLITKLSHLDIVRITLNANPSSLFDAEYIDVDGELKRATKEHKQEKRLEKLKARVGSNYVPETIKKEDMTIKGLPNALLHILEKVVQEHIQGTNLLVQPACSFVYTDTKHQMLTLTCIVMSKDFDITREIDQKILDSWPLANKTWENPLSIELPDLSTRERLYIEQMLHSKEPSDIADEMSFLFSEGSLSGEEAIKKYLLYYRHLPHFSKVVV